MSIRPSEYLTVHESFYLQTLVDSDGRLVQHSILPQQGNKVAQAMYIGRNPYNQYELGCRCDVFLRKKTCDHIYNAYRAGLEVPVIGAFNFNILIYRNPWLAVPITVQDLDERYGHFYVFDSRDQHHSISIVSYPTTWMEIRREILEWLPSIEYVGRCSSEFHKDGIFPEQDRRIRNQWFFNIFNIGICPNCDEASYVDFTN